MSYSITFNRVKYYLQGPGAIAGIGDKRFLILPVLPAGQKSQKAFAAFSAETHRIIAVGTGPLDVFIIVQHYFSTGKKRQPKPFNHELFFSQEALSKKAQLLANELQSVKH